MLFVNLRMKYDCFYVYDEENLSMLYL